MAKVRKLLALAAGLNTIIFVGEMLGGAEGHSTSLIMDGVHNFSDELALVCLFLAYLLPVTMSRNFQRLANALISISVFLIWQSVNNIIHPVPTIGYIPLIAGLLAAIANWGVARILYSIKDLNAAIRLTYIHIVGDVYVSLAPVVAGLLVLLTGKNIFDPIIAIIVGVWLIWATIKEIAHSHDELIWPEHVADQ